MKKQVKKTDALLFLKKKGIDESTNNVSTLNQTALLMEEFAVFKLKEEARWLFIEQQKLESEIAKNKEIMSIKDKSIRDLLDKVQTLMDQKHAISKQAGEYLDRLIKYEPIFHLNAKGA
jgi:hypothetical protein